MQSMHRFGFDHTYARELPGAFVPWKPASVPVPSLLFANLSLADELGLPSDVLQGPDAAALFAGNLLPEDAQPIAQAYAGHQFGGFSPQLGDGRALLLGELIDCRGQRRDIAFKGSGRTPFSRGGDGKAAVGPMLREAVISEAMHALGVPTTRALAVAATGEPVYREAVLPGAVLTRVASSHLRVGTFQFFAARGDMDTLRRLADYTIARHDPGLVGAPDRYLGLLSAVARRQARLVAQWMNLGFIHGVMNTDNMALSGETIDYGPCAFMEAYDPATVFSSIDHGGRYAYGNQPSVARWNLARFAETLLPLMAAPEDEPAVERAVAEATTVIDHFSTWLASELLDGQRAKLGWRAAVAAEDAADSELANDWLTLLHTQGVDFTLAWRYLATAAEGNPEPLRNLFSERGPMDAWLSRWHQRSTRDDQSQAERAARMRQVSPAVIPRNHLVEEALAAATAGDLGLFNALLTAVRAPWDESALSTRYAMPAPSELAAGYRTFCGT